MKISLIAASLMMFVIGSALAAEEFFVVQNEKGKLQDLKQKGRWRKQADRDGRLRHGRGGEGSQEPGTRMQRGKEQGQENVGIGRT